MDALGNHDTRNTDTAAALAWTRRFTVSRYHDRSATSCFSQDRLAIVALEQTPRPSTHRFFNFFGITSAAATVPLPACARAPGVTVVAFGHYPLFMVDDRPDAVTSVPEAVAQAMSGTARPRAPVPALAMAVAYLCGHLHDGLGDFLHTRYLRILRNKASAANLLIPLSLIASGTHRASLNSKALTLNYARPIASWPLTVAFSRFSTRHSMPRGLAFWYARALLHHRHVDAVHTYVIYRPLLTTHCQVTSPKAAAYGSPREPWQHVATASAPHIHVLVWDPHPTRIPALRVWLDGQELGRAHRGRCRAATRVDAGNNTTACPLFVLPWNPAALRPGLHTLRVVPEVFSVESPSP